ncbi:hypothetical protein AB1Y20_014821 [Prymnesium parvum]|uniref:Uncharacterized protein n=1 Tax=Prymnesium parvum TaxID=97485 RepID=A0AB34JYT6_PRYPA
MLQQPTLDVAAIISSLRAQPGVDLPSLLSLVRDLSSCVYVPRTQLLAVARAAPTGAAAVSIIELCLCLLEAHDVQLHAAHLVPSPRASELLHALAPPPPRPSRLSTSEPRPPLACSPARAPPSPLAAVSAALGEARLSSRPGKEKLWGEMSAAERAAAVRIGYDAASWDAGAVPPTCEVAWEQLAAAERDAAAALGYSRDEWEEERLADAPSSPQAAEGGEASGEGGVAGKHKLWAELSAAEVAAARCLGYADAAAWDAGDVPPTCELPWDQLQPRDRRAAEALGYARAEWERARANA